MANLEQTPEDVGELVLVEGDEEVQYVLLEMPMGVPASLLAPGTTVTLKELDSDTPQLVLGNGVTVQGKYEENLGSIMCFEVQDAQANQVVSYKGHTGTKIVFAPKQ